MANTETDCKQQMLIKMILIDRRNIQELQNIKKHLLGLRRRLLPKQCEGIYDAHEQKQHPRHETPRAPGNEYNTREANKRTAFLANYYIAKTSRSDQLQRGDIRASRTWPWRTTLLQYMLIMVANRICNQDRPLKMFTQIL